jgi:hypothetical protein
MRQPTRQYDANVSIDMSDGSHFARCPSFPNESIIHAHMLWIEMYAVVDTQPIDNASNIAYE